LVTTFNYEDFGYQKNLSLNELLLETNSFSSEKLGS